MANGTQDGTRRGRKRARPNDSRIAPSACLTETPPERRRPVSAARRGLTSAVSCGEESNITTRWSDLTATNTLENVFFSHLSLFSSPSLFSSLRLHPSAGLICRLRRPECLSQDRRGWERTLPTRQDCEEPLRIFFRNDNTAAVKPATIFARMVFVYIIRKHFLCFKKTHKRSYNCTKLNENMSAKKKSAVTYLNVSELSSHVYPSSHVCLSSHVYLSLFPFSMTTTMITRSVGCHVPKCRDRGPCVACRSPRTLVFSCAYLVPLEIKWA